MANSVKIEHYNIGKTLGEGAFGKVKRKKEFIFFILIKNYIIMKLQHMI